MIKRPFFILNAIALLCVVAVIFALISQYAFDMRPCAWCVFQRLIFLVIAAVCWLSVLLGRYLPVVTRIGAGLSALLGIGGILAAWYQYSVASQLFSCDLTFADNFMTSSGLDANVSWLFGIFATCSDARVELLGVEYALWSMSLFIIIAIVSAMLALTKNTHR